MPGQPSEGVIKFSQQHTAAALPEWVDPADLQYWFRRCRELDLVGQCRQRYAGAAYGNLSQRAERGFVVTGSQTGGLATLKRQHFAWVQEVDAARNVVTSCGPVAPSSESMTHAQVYALLPQVNFVIHVHHRGIWENAAQLGLAVTDPAAEYGTPQMAAEVERLLGQAQVQASCALSMGGHEDGIITFGATAGEAGMRLLELYRAASARPPAPGQEHC